MYIIIYRFAAILKESLKFAPLEKLEKLQEYEDQLKSAIKGKIENFIALVSCFLVNMNLQ